MHPSSPPSMLFSRRMPSATCAAVLLPAGVEQEAEEFGTLLAELSGRFGESVQGYESERTALSAMGAGRVDFVHVAVFDSEELAPPDIEASLPSDGARCRRW